MRWMRDRSILILALGLLVADCTTDEFTGPDIENKPPTAWIALGPPEGIVTTYKVHIFWGGWDPDGEVLFFEYLITDNESGVFDPADTTVAGGVSGWLPITVKDSPFTFTADQLADDTDFETQEPLEFRRSHTFFIRSVDDKGARSIPAYRSFTSRTLSPEVDITQPDVAPIGAARVPPFATFRWKAQDFVSNDKQIQPPDSVRWILLPTKGFGQDWDTAIAYIRNNPAAPEWSSWHDFNAPNDSGKIYVADPPLDFGDYVFAVQVKDEAGAISPVFDEKRNIRRVNVTDFRRGPKMFVTNEHIGTFHSATPTINLIERDLPEGLPLQFTWWGDASSYGARVVGYRYGWDITDLNDTAQWEVDLTPFNASFATSRPRTFFFGQHIFYVEVIDNSGFFSRVALTINVIPFTMDRNLLIVDDWIEGPSHLTGFSNTQGALPDDAEHDAFWADMARDVEGFSPSSDMVQLGGAGLQSLPIRVLANYRAVVWSTHGSHTGLRREETLFRELVRFRPPGFSQTLNTLRLYMVAGGHVLVSLQTLYSANTAFSVQSDPW